jgi:hypothetical protein
MKLDLTILFVLALALAVFSASQMVQAIRNIGQGGIVMVVLCGLLFIFAMFMLAFGMYATEHEKGKIKNRVKLFDRWLDKESK